MAPPSAAPQKREINSMEVEIVKCVPKQLAPEKRPKQQDEKLYIYVKTGKK